MIFIGDFILLRLLMFDFSFFMVIDLILFLDICSIFIFFFSIFVCRFVFRSCRVFRILFKLKLLRFLRKDFVNLKFLRV